MKIDGDYAILESFAEWEFFGFDISINQSYKCIRMMLKGNDAKYRINKYQVKEKLLLPQDVKAIFYFPGDYLRKINCFYLPLHQSNIKVLANCVRSTLYFDYYLPVNILTINKTIQELYDLGKWCGLWE